MPHLKEQELTWTSLDQRAVDTVRVLAADAVEKVGNGHPGTAMSLAPAAYLLFQKMMRHDPKNPDWIGRDRFVLSPGHTSLTLYIQLFLSGYGLELKDLQALRTWGSLTPGHPEYKHTAGVEITTGPLGQGLASAVGFAYSQRRQRGLFDADAARRHQPVRPHHLGHRLRRRPPGGCHLRGIVPRRPPGTRQPRRDLRREPHLHRRRHRHRLHRGRPQALRGLRLARPARRLDEDRRLPGRRPGAARRASGGQGRDVQALHRLAAHHHRLPRAEEAEHRQDPRLGPGLRGGGCPEGSPRLRPREDLRGRRRGAGPRPRRRGPRCPRTQGMGGVLRSLAVRQPRSAPHSWSASKRANCRPNWTPPCPCSPQARTSPPVPPPARS